MPKLKLPVREKTEKEAVLNELPPFLKSRYTRLMIIGTVGWAIIMILLIAIGGSLKANLTLMLSFTAVAAFIVVMAMMFKRRVLRDGYKTIDGYVCLVKYSVKPGFNKRPIAYHLKTEEGVYEIPVFKGTPLAEMKETLRIYTAVDPYISNRDGLMILDPFWGYELLGGIEEDPEESSEEEDEKEVKKDSIVDLFRSND